jgi:hypothetical protein
MSATSGSTTDAAAAVPAESFAEQIRAMQLAIKKREVREAKDLRDRIHEQIRRRATDDPDSTCIEFQHGSLSKSLSQRIYSMLAEDKLSIIGSPSKTGVYISWAKQ